jgi:uncharacterized protein YijF (DUF1287 family)
MKRTVIAVRCVIAMVVLAVADGAMGGLDVKELVASAQSQIDVTVGYDPAYRKLAYPGGDVPLETGVCCDVVIRALRQQGVDLQRLVHEDMERNFSRYPRNWGLKAPDSNIDHRRVPNLACYFRRQGWSVAVSSNAAAYRPGDIVTWNLGKGLTHIGIVSDRQSAKGTPLMIHNIGNGTREDDVLFAFTLTGHFRPTAATSQASDLPRTLAEPRR